MIKRFSILTAAVLAALFFLLSLYTQVTAVPLTRAPAQMEISKIAPMLIDQLANSSADTFIRVIIDFTETADFTAVQRIQNPAARRANLIQQLQTTNAAALQAIQPTLNTLQAAGQIRHSKPLWLINSLAIEATPAAIATLATRGDVAQIRLDNSRKAYVPPEMAFNLDASQTAGQPASGLPSWGIDRIEAQKVWQAFGIDGNGVTVAIVDTGVDWQHPDLLPNYRGNLGGGQFDHSASWYYPISPTVTTPFDAIGHGTHVAGTAVGQNGIGVAPGAKWIAVGVANSFGFIYDSDIHDAFAWLMAPGGDPALAPDVVNNSWSGSGYTTTFVEDITALHAAGIMTVFAAGNNGPFTTTVGAPGSYTNTLAVGASDDMDEVAWFSARGPSPVTDKIKPWIVAPGTHILSSLPNDSYGYYNGTSMATPHVVGTIALLLAANPSLTFAGVEDVLAQTAVPISTTHPNNDSGWGVLNAYTAVASQLPTGTLNGRVTINGRAPAAATATITATSGTSLTLSVTGDGHFKAMLLPGTYTVTVTAFGAEPQTIAPVLVTDGSSQLMPVNLSQLAGGVIQGIVTNDNGEAVTGTVQVLNTPLSVQTDALGRYTLHLPAGYYKMQVLAVGYEGRQWETAVAANDTIIHNIILPAAPRLLLVDSGQWYFDSRITYYQNALAALHYTADLWQIRNPYTDIPTLETLNAYDAVIWSNPQDSPGYVFAGDVLNAYLEGGGHLLISGQNVAAFDAYGFDAQAWFYTKLQAVYLGKLPAYYWLYGRPDSLFANAVFTLNGGNSASNQWQTDVAGIQKGSLTEPAVYYSNGQIAGLQAGHCQPFRMVYFGFGLEGVRDGQSRMRLLADSLAYFDEPPVVNGLAWQETAVYDYVLPGDEMVYTLTVRNLSETMTDTVSLAVTSEVWQSELVTKTMTLGPCEMAQTVLHVHVPENAPENSEHQLRVTAVSGNFGYIQTHLPMTHKTPAHLLLVDDDRFYNREAEYEAALDAIGISYDVWEVGWDNNVRGQMRQELLNAYDFVVWYTGYDWFSPIEPAEAALLRDYLDQGGRLFLSSQDFMYYHLTDPLASRYLGAVNYQESITPTMVFAPSWSAVSPELQWPQTLTFSPYQNHGDGLVNNGNSQPFLWHDQGVATVAAAGDSWRSLFWGIPWETLPVTAQLQSMQDGVGWLSDLGDSQLVGNGRVARLAASQRFTLTVANSVLGHETAVSVTNPLPAQFNLLPGSLQGGTLAGNGRAITWQGQLAPGESHVIMYETTLSNSTPANTSILNEAFIHYDYHDLTIRRAVMLWADSPDFSGSTLTAVSNPPAPVQNITYTLALTNSGLPTTKPVTAVLHLPNRLNPVTPTLTVSTGNAVWQGNGVVWTNAGGNGGMPMLTVVVTRALAVEDVWHTAVAEIDDGETAPVMVEVAHAVRPYQQWLPAIFLIADQP
ncbi:MAG: hypothetical protein Kow0080_29020 [Candidatus Promineifilaceae bacterium]